MATILLSIRPEYMKKIFEGSKKYEYRKTKYSKKIDKVIFYETAPTKKVVGQASVSNILTDKPSNIWQLTNQYSGTTKEFFDTYYEKCDMAVAIQLSNVEKYDKPKPLKEYNIDYIPQSFVYLNE